MELGISPASLGPVTELFHRLPWATLTVRTVLLFYAPDPWKAWFCVAVILS